MSNTMYIPTSPDFYGSDADTARECAYRLQAALEREFPDVRFVLGNGRDDFEDELLQEQIIAAITANWIEWAF